MTTAVAWPTFETAILGRELVAERTMSFTFAKPPGWDFRAGQFIDITLLDPSETDAEGNTRGFSISSAPSEGTITFTTRLRDTAFKRVLHAMPLDSLARIEGPFGDLRLHTATRPAVVLTGGIGITPFRSILVEAVRSAGLRYPVVLFYSNRQPRDAAFLEELRELSIKDRNLTFVPTMTKPDGIEKADGIEPWDGERGHIDAAMLGRYAGHLHDPIYYLTGPSGLVQGLRAMLVGAGVDEDDVRTEEFTGY